jgi:hypothetical protein
MFRHALMIVASAALIWAAAGWYSSHKTIGLFYVPQVGHFQQPSLGADAVSACRDWAVEASDWRNGRDGRRRPTTMNWDIQVDSRLLGAIFGKRVCTEVSVSIWQQRDRRVAARRD